MKLIKEIGVLEYKKNIAGEVAKILITSICS